MVFIAFNKVDISVREDLAFNGTRPEPLIRTHVKDAGRCEAADVFQSNQCAKAGTSPPNIASLEAL
jgi:hypothetical protein